MLNKIETTFEVQITLVTLGVAIVIGLYNVISAHHAGNPSAKADESQNSLRHDGPRPRSLWHTIGVYTFLVVVIFGLVFGLTQVPKNAPKPGLGDTGTYVPPPPQPTPAGRQTDFVLTPETIKRVSIYVPLNSADEVVNQSTRILIDQLIDAGNNPKTDPGAAIDAVVSIEVVGAHRATRLTNSGDTECSVDVKLRLALGRNARRVTIASMPDTSVDRSAQDSCIRAFNSSISKLLKRLIDSPSKS